MKRIILLPTAAAMLLGGTVVAGSSLSQGYAPIDRAELVSQRSDNAYDAIRALRHDWLHQDRSTSEIPAVFIEMRCGDPDCLQVLEAAQIDEIRFVEPGARAAGGPPASEHGAIVVTMRTRSTVLTPGAARR